MYMGAVFFGLVFLMLGLYIFEILKKRFAEEL